MSDTESLIQIRDLQTHFFTDDGVARAVDGVSYDIPRGKTLALVGEMMGGLRGGGARERRSGGVQVEAAARRAAIRVRRVRFLGGGYMTSTYEGFGLMARRPEAGS